MLLLASLAPGFDPSIQAHLLEVVQTLREESPALADDVAARRAETLDLLETYALAGEYPENPRRPHPRDIAPPRAFQGDGARAPVFVDADGSHCAVGYLVAAEEPELVAAIRADHNDAWLSEMPTGVLTSWAAHHGMSLDELAWIQPSYTVDLPSCRTFVPTPEDLPAGTTGTCEGIDIAVLELGEMTDFACAQCDGAVEIWLPVHNVGDTTAERGQIVALADGQDLVTAPMPPVVAGEVRYVGPLTLDPGQPWEVRIEATGDCDPSNNIARLGDAMTEWGAVQIDEDGDGEPTAECGGTDCDDSDATIGPPACFEPSTMVWDPVMCTEGCPTAAPMEAEPETCGCRSAAGGWTAWWMLVLLGRRRRS